MSLINEYEILSRSNDIPLAKTAGRFFFEKLLASFELSSNKQDILALFRDISNKEYQRLLFAKFIGIVNIETSGFCNRKCSYCPVGLHGRHDRSLFMKSEIFNIILENLRLLGFESSISLNGYNEPLLDPNISMHIKRLRDACPRSFIGFNSNGDFLDNEMLNGLIESSLNRLNITLHTLPNETYNDDKSLKRIKSYYAKLGLQAPDIQVISNQSCISSMRLDNLNLIVTTMNWGKIGNDRGGEIESLSMSDRKEPCVRVFREIFIDYRGFAHLCCNVYYDKGKPIGNVAKQSLEEIFCNNHAWRKALFSYHDKPKPCQTCKDSGFSKPEWNDKQKQILTMASKFIKKL